MPHAVEVAHRHAVRELKSGTLGLVEACQLDECADERLLDLIGFALIGGLRGDARLRAGAEALRISAKLNVGPYLYAYQAPSDLVVACAAAVAEVTIDEEYASRPPRRRGPRLPAWMIWGTRAFPAPAMALWLAGCQNLG